MTTKGLHSSVITFGRELRDLRLQMGLTLAQLASRAGLTPSYIGSIENGARDPSLSTVVSIASGLGVSTSQLFGGKELGPVGRRVARVFDDVPPSYQDGLISIMRSFLYDEKPPPRPRSRKKARTRRAASSGGRSSSPTRA